MEAKDYHHIEEKKIIADYYISASKGIGINDLKLAHQIMKPLLAREASFVQLSGPSFAYEVMRGLPTAVTVGYKGKNVMQFFMKKWIFVKCFF